MNRQDDKKVPFFLRMEKPQTVEDQYGGLCGAFRARHQKKKDWLSSARGMEQVAKLKGKGSKLATETCPETEKS